MKKILLFSLVIIALSVKNGFAQTVTPTASPSTINLSVSNQTTLTATISSGSFTTANTSWADPGANVTVSSTSFSSGNTVATATATITSTEARTFTLNYRRSGSSSNFSSSVTVNVVDLSITPSTAQNINTGSSIDFDYANRSGFPNGGSYAYSWQVTKTGGIIAGDISYINSTSATTSNPSLQFNSAGTYSVALTVTRNGVSATSPATTVTVVAPPPPVVTIAPSAAQNINASSYIDFSVTPSNFPGSGGYTYSWIVTKTGGIVAGDISYINSTSATSAAPRIQFNTAGTYSVSVTVTRGGKSATSPATTVVVVTPPPSLTISPSTTQNINTGTFINFGTSASGFPSGTYTYSWQVTKVGGIAPGDISYINSTTATSATPRIQFNAAGTYSVVVTVSRGGVTATSAVTIVGVVDGIKSFNTPIYSANFKGGHAIFGNTIMAVYNSGNGNNGGTINTTATDNYANMQFCNVDYAAGNPQGVQSASSADLKLPAGTNTIKFARLYWGGRITNTQIPTDGTYSSLRTVKIRKGSSGAYTSLNVPLSQVNTTSVYGGDPVATAYQSWADITSVIQTNGAGTYTVADIAASIGKTTDLYGNYAGWSIVVVYENNNLNYFATRIYDAFIQVANSASQTITLTGFDAPANALLKSEAYLTAFAWEGDAAYSGDYMKINGTNFSNTINTSTNMWNGTISDTTGANNSSLVTTKSPNLNTSLAVDIDQVLVGTGYGINPNATTVQIQFGTDQDQYFPSILAFSIKVKDPQFSISKKAVNSNNQEVTSLKANQTFTYVIAGKNIGDGDAANSYVLDSLPAGITYVPGSLQIVKSGTGGITGMMTDASNDDKAFYTPAAGGKKPYIKFYIGSGATNTAGGLLQPNDEYEVRFNAATSANVNDLTAINIGYVSTFSNVIRQSVVLQATSALSGPQAAPLAISLLSFTVSKQNGNALLNWTTEKEQDNDHFDIERSTDGVHFSKVGVVAGSYTTNEKQNYQLADPLAGLRGVVYYRLKDVDIYGKGSYSKIIALRLTVTGSEMNTSIYPNPFTDNFKISIQSAKKGAVTIRVLALSGKEMISKRQRVQTGQNIIVLSDVSKLASGMYVLQLVTEEGTTSQKLIKK